MRAKIADFGLATIKTETMSRSTLVGGTNGGGAGQGTIQWMGECI